MMAMKRMLSIMVGTLLFLLAPIGCTTVESSKDNYTCQITAGNRSSKDIRFVVIDPDGTKHEFGFLAGGTSGVKGMLGQFRFSDAFAVVWDEDGATQKVPINIMKYEKKKRQIKSFAFYYLGDKRWEVIAQSSTDENSPEVKP